MFRKLFFLVSLFLVACGLRSELAAAAEKPDAPAERVPQFLLGLVHAPEVHEELGLSPADTAALEELLRSVDAKWLPTRALPEQERRAVIAELEAQVWKWFGTQAKSAQVERLQQLELYAQGTRMLLRDDVATRIGLDDAQRKKFADLTAATDEAARKLAQAAADDAKRAALQEQLSKATQAERDGLKSVFTPDQQQRLQALLGKPFEISKLSRIYPLAPEFASGNEWLNSKPRTMQALRGKVVVIHFYAFQCENCHANFPIYRRWHNLWQGKDVALIGIQTPETEPEHELSAVRAAAKENDLTFPIVADLKSGCWQAWGNTMWPTVWVVDKQGYIRVWWEGELNWKGATGDKSIESVVERLLQEK